MRSQGPLADAAELARLTELWLDFDQKVWSFAGVPDLRGMDAEALANLAGMLERARGALLLMRTRCDAAQTRAEALLVKPIGRA